VHSYICGRVELNASDVIRSKAIVVLGKDTGIQMVLAANYLMPRAFFCCKYVKA